MACFVVSTVAALGVAAAKYVVRHNEKKKALKVEVEPKEYKFGSGTKMSKRLGYLEMMLWGGSFLLAGEHLLHGEVSLTWPFLTAVTEGPEATSEMLTEMGTVGVAMFGAIVVAWAVAMFVVDFIKFRKHKENKVVSEVK